MKKARSLYKKLLERTKHVKVWISYAQFEAGLSNNDEARAVYNSAYNTLKSNDEKEECVMLVESWKSFETTLGDAEKVAAVEKKMPTRVIKKRPVTTDEGMEAGWEEYYDYIFPGEETAQTNLKILEKARLWKKQKAT